jgi:predicted restriction endonuclease
MHSRNPDIMSLATSIGRTPSAIALKMTNFASLDPTLHQTGMSNSSKLDREVWAEFFEAMTLSLMPSEPVRETGFGESAKPFEPFPLREGLDVMRLVKTRLNQDFFRKLVLTSYEGKCALTELDAPELLIASHIVPWSEDSTVRMAPQNGICLNALHDRAFDQGFLTFGDDYSVIYSRKLPNIAREALESFGSGRLRLPARFIPDPALLALHRKNKFRGV